MWKRLTSFLVLSALICGAGAIQALGQTQGPVRITLDEAVKLALDHNHTLQAERSTILQSQAEETTANMRPNPTLSWDAQFLPLFQPTQVGTTYFDQNAQFDIGLSYLFEIGRKRQHRLQAAQDVTAQTKSQVADNERALTFLVASDFVSVQLAESTLALAEQDVKSFQSTVDIGEAQLKAGAISEGDYLKIKLQLLQFQTDFSQAQLAKVQALISLRQQLGFESVPADYDVAGELDYQPVQAKRDDLEALALRQRPDLRAAQQGVTAAQSQYEVQKSIAKQDLTAGADYSHTSGLSSVSLFFSIPLPIFNRNQGEIARTRYAIGQSQETEKAVQEQVLTDVVNAFENLQTNDQIIRLYRTGYLDAAKESRDISEYAYKRGAASLLDFLDAERSYRAVELAYRQSLASYQTALEQLREAVGSRNLP
jgi:cobalt-zinc-cadmium efflux system outer membrane protein